MTTPPPPPPAEPGPDARAVLRAAEQLTEQVRRIADALTTPVAKAADDDATTPNDDGPRCVCGDPIELAGDPAVWRHRPGGAHGLDAHTPRPPDWLTPTRCEHRGPHPGFTCAEVDASQPYFRVRWDQEQQAPAADEDAQRTARRESLRTLLARLDRGITRGVDFRPSEAALLRRHVEAEIGEADTARAVAAGNKRHVQVMYADLLETQAGRDTADRIRAEVQRDRDQHAAVLAEVLRHFTHETHPGRRCLNSGHVPVETVDRWRSVVAPTVERPWWVDVAEIRAELEEAQAAIERVRERCQPVRDREGPAGMINATQILRLLSPTWPDGNYEAPALVAVLDGTEQPTTERQAVSGASLCTAALADSIRPGTVHCCIASAGHYDEGREPEFRDNGPADPGGWHHTEPDPEGDRMVWSDRADGATPHGEQPTTEQS